MTWKFVHPKIRGVGPTFRFFYFQAFCNKYFMSLLANSPTQIQFRCIDWDGVRTDVVLAPQTIAAYQMEHHNVYNHQINLDYLKYHQSVNSPGFFVISALLTIRNIHNNLHWLMCDFRADVLLSYPSIFTQQLLRPPVVCHFVWYPVAWWWHMHVTCLLGLHTRAGLEGW